MKPISYEKQRIQNIVLFFVANTQNVGIIKLSKLLYFADRESYIETGFKITGLEYRAQERGPVPMDVWAELQTKVHPNQIRYDLKKMIKRERPHSARAGNDEVYFVPKHGTIFKDGVFSEYEIELMKKIAAEYITTSGASMSTESHLGGKPWEQTWNLGAGKGKIIDFDLDVALYLDTEKIIERQKLQEYAKQSLIALDEL